MQLKRLQAHGRRQWRTSARRLRLGCQTRRDCMGTFSKVSAKLSRCKSVKMQARNCGSDLGGHMQVCGPRSQESSIETLCQGVQNEEARPNSKSLFASQLFSAVPLLEAVKVLASIMMSVGRAKVTVEVGTPPHQQSAFPVNSPETRINPSSSRRSSKIW